MKVLLIFLVSFLSLFSYNVFSFENTGFLKGGISVGVAEMNSLGKKDFFLGTGFNTHGGYRWTNWELQASSYIYVAKMDEGMVFESNNQTIVASGNIRSVSLVPMAKYLANVEPKKNWKLYFAAGPVFSLQSFSLKTFTRNDGVIANDYKASFQSYGAAFSIGMEEFTQYKEMHPVYIELLYQVQKSHKSFLNDATDKKMVRTIATEATGKKHLNQMLILSFGMTVF